MRKSKAWGRTAVGAFALTTAAASLCMCSPSADITTYCEEWSDCSDGNDADTEGCIAALEGQADAADDLDCRDDFDAWIECRAAKSKCEKDEWGTYFTTGGKCDDEGEDLDRCFKIFD